MRRSSYRCHGKAKPCVCIALCSLTLASVRLADMVLHFFYFVPSTFSPSVNFLKFELHLLLFLLKPKALKPLFSFYSEYRSTKLNTLSMGSCC